MFKTEKSKEMFKRILTIFLSVVFVVSAFILLYELVWVPYKQTRETQKIQKIHGYVDTDSNEETFNRLREINKDIKGWIYIPNTVINYPVLEPPSDDPKFYLFRDYEKNDTKYGSIFVDATYGITEDLKNTVIHGHHMNDGKMFGDLLKYSDLDFYKSSPIIKYDTIYETGIWKVISVFKTNVDASQGEPFNYLQLTFSSDSEFLNYIQDVKLRSIINTPVDIKIDDKLITLSTCSYELDNFRTVIVARKVRYDESTEVDVNSASINPNPIYPDAWYGKYGGSKPADRSFEEALQAGEIDWYVE